MRLISSFSSVIMNTALSMCLLLLLYYNGSLVYSKNHTKCDGIYRKGRILHGRFALLSSSSITECAKLCFYRQQCKSFSYCFTKKKCILCRSLKAKLGEDADSVFSLIKTWNPRIAGSCFNHSCKIMEMCLPGKNAYYCLQLDIDCGVPLQLNSSVITWIAYSCKQPYLVSFNMINSTYSESSWRYECLNTNTSCRMKTIWHDGSNHYLDISCTMTNNGSSQSTNFSYFCTKTEIVGNFNHIRSCSPQKFRHGCNITCDVQTNKDNDYPKRNCTRRLFCRWLRFPEVQPIHFCIRHIKIENGTISFEGVMKMVCEVFDQFSIEANKRKLPARLLDFHVGVWNNTLTEKIGSTTIDSEKADPSQTEVSKTSDTSENQDG
ncbi:uncharacterized protein LOC106871881 isoform X2 [Octopus bimaculoides]|uniref:uncharacterized protein LOC106871881 isoform X2 n=1 Tax=Octopus bimaculoides TaxID=37653 RepID=UPI00071C4A11|nr:uncharacterized protein LOC106871881 isoform X2 [Octopus bimaculoides]|eukprot:XP_014774128.1 PREDICTED: uncharacterized protein LOC106871881 isoform X2 [Octopus bimaculoides]